jgi:hypothetical protein
MATGSFDANGIWLYGEDDSEATFSALLNKGMSSVSDTVTRLEDTEGAVQIVSATKTDTFSTSATTTWVDITGVSVTITPKSSSNRVFITGILQHGWSGVNPTYFRLVRNSTAIGTAANSGALFGYESAVTNSNSTFATTQISFNFLDTPSTTSATTYKVQVFNVSSGTSWFGRRPADNSVGGIQTITAIEMGV